MASSSSSSIAALRAAKSAMRKAMAQRLAKMSRGEIVEQSEQITRRIVSSPTYQNAKTISIYVSMASGEADTEQLCRHALQAGKILYVPHFAAPPPSLPPPPPAPPSNSSSPSPCPLPRSTFSKDMRMLRIRTLSEYMHMKPNKWGIREPEVDWDVTFEDPSSKEATAVSVSPKEGRQPREDALLPSTGGTGLDLILAPGVAFDDSAGRLGHGKGYYDRYLSKAEEFAKGLSRPPPVCVALGLTPQLLAPGEKVPQDEYDRTLDAIIVPGGVIRSEDDLGRWKEEQ